MADVFTDKGEEMVADYVSSGGSAPATWYIGWGTGAGTALATDTTLFTEVDTPRDSATDTQPSANVNQFVATRTSGSSQIITNAGVFDANTGGNMLLKSDFSGVSLNTNDSIQFTFQVTWGQ